jgi:hypothetical protein
MNKLLNMFNQAGADPKFKIVTTSDTRSTTATSNTTLVLSPEQAAWLHEVMQNPMHDAENAKDYEMRRLFWEATGDKNET